MPSEINYASKFKVVKPMIKKTIKANFLKLIYILTGLSFSLLFTRLYTTDDVGNYYAKISYIQIVAIISSLGVIEFIAKQAANGIHYALHRQKFIYISLLITASITIFAGTQDRVTSLDIWVFLGGVVVLTRMLTASFKGMGNTSLFQVYDELIPSFIKLFLAATCFYSQNTLDTNLVILIPIALSAVLTIAAHRSLKLKYSELEINMGDTGHFWMISMSAVFISNSSRVFADLYFDTELVANVAIGTQIAMVVMAPNFLLGTIFYRDLVNETENKLALRIRRAKKLGYIAAIYGISVSIIWYYFGSEITRFWGNDFVYSYHFALALILSYTVRASVGTVHEIYISLDKAGIIFKAELFSWLTGILAFFILVEHYKEQAIYLLAFIPIALPAILLRINLNRVD